MQKAWRGGRFTNRTEGRRFRFITSTANRDGLMGIEVGGASVRRTFWEQALKYWHDNQRADGGWADRDGPSDAGSTAGAVTSVLICMKHLGKTRQEALQSKAVSGGLKWLGKNHNAQITKPENQSFYGYLQVLARLGVFANSRKFGQADWFTSTAKVLKNHQRDNGSWPGVGLVRNTARAVLFLAVGSRLPSQ